MAPLRSGQDDLGFGAGQIPAAPTRGRVRQEHGPDGQAIGPWHTSRVRRILRAMHESDSKPDIPGIILGVVIAVAPIVVLFAAAELLKAGVLAHPSGALMVSITPYFFASALLIPIGLLIVGFALPTDGSPRSVVVGAILLVGVPTLLVVWFVAALGFSGAAGAPF